MTKLKKLTDRLRNEDGMTLIEMMIAISVLGVILVPVTTSFLLGILESTSAKERTADASSAQLISSYLLTDLQSSQTVATSGSGCGSGGTVKLQVAWADPDPAGVHNVVVAYIDQPSATAGERELYRYICTTTGGSTTVDNTLLALNLDTSAFAVTCKDAAGATVACASARKVAVHVEADSVKPKPESSYEPLLMDFEVTRRVSP